MKKTLLVFISCILMFVSGCSGKYKRIEFDQQFMDGEFERYVNAETAVINTASADLPGQIPMYKIYGKEITAQDVELVQQKLKTATAVTSRRTIKRDGNKLDGWFADFGTGTFTMSEKELERMAWETLRSLTFLEGEYEYSGIRGRDTILKSDGEHTTRVLVSFYRQLDDIRVVGNDRCDLWFNDWGLVEIHVAQYRYEKAGTIDMVSLDDAKQRIKAPDSFTMGNQETLPHSNVNTLQVENIRLRLVNQASERCTILQPVYVFSGSAELANGTKKEFTSIVIAIPESYTR